MRLCLTLAWAVMAQSATQSLYRTNAHGTDYFPVQGGNGTAAGKLTIRGYTYSAMTNTNGNDPNGIAASGAAVNPIDGSLWTVAIDSSNGSLCLLRVLDEKHDVYCPPYPDNTVVRSRILFDDEGYLYIGLAQNPSEGEGINYIINTDPANPYTLRWTLSGQLYDNFFPPWLMGFVNATSGNKYLIWAGLSGDVQVPLNGSTVPDLTQAVYYTSYSNNGAGLSNLLYSPDGKYVYNNARSKPCVARYDLPLTKANQKVKCYPQNSDWTTARWEITVDTELTVYVTSISLGSTAGIFANGTVKWSVSTGFGYLSLSDDEKTLIGGELVESEGYEPDNRMGALDTKTGEVLWNKPVGQIWSDVSGCFNNRVASADITPKVLPAGPQAPHGLAAAYCALRVGGQAVRFVDVRTGAAIAGTIPVDKESTPFFLADLNWNFWVYEYYANVTHVSKYQLTQVLH